MTDHDPAGTIGMKPPEVGICMVLYVKIKFYWNTIII